MPELPLKLPSLLSACKSIEPVNNDPPEDTIELPNDEAASRTGVLQFKAENTT